MMFNTITWIALSVSNFFNFYDNKDYYFEEKENASYQAKIEKEHQLTLSTQTNKDENVNIL